MAKASWLVKLACWETIGCPYYFSGGGYVRTLTFAVDVMQDYDFVKLKQLNGNHARSSPIWVVQWIQFIWNEPLPTNAPVVGKARYWMACLYGETPARSANWNTIVGRTGFFWVGYLWVTLWYVPSGYYPSSAFGFLISFPSNGCSVFAWVVPLFYRSFPTATASFFGWVFTTVLPRMICQKECRKNLNYSGIV